MPAVLGKLQLHFSIALINQPSLSAQHLFDALISAFLLELVSHCLLQRSPSFTGI